MRLRHIVVATDESEIGRHAVRWTLGLAAHAGARVTVMRAVPVGSVPAMAGAFELGGSDGEPPSGEVERLERWLAPELDGSAQTTVAVAYGVPSIEIARFAERHGADLLVLGRKARTQAVRLLLGDTADAVARRSRVPCLFVPADARPIRTVLAAADGSERAASVLDAALAFAHSARAQLQVATVEPLRPDEPAALAQAIPVARTEKVRRQITDAYTRFTASIGDGDSRVPSPPSLIVRRGVPVDELLEAIAIAKADAIVIGYHRGGLAGVIEAGSVARRIAHQAPCVVLTVPL